MKKLSVGRIVILSNFLRKSGVSLMYDFVPNNKGCRIISNIIEILSVGLSILDTIGLPGGSTVFL